MGGQTQKGQMKKLYYGTDSGKYCTGLKYLYSAGVAVTDSRQKIMTHIIINGQKVVQALKEDFILLCTDTES